MSERGTFVTSFLYDPTLAPILRAALELVARPGSLTEIYPGPAPNVPREETRAFAGVMHGTYSGEESLTDMPNLLDEEVVPRLDPEHGQFSIVVMPEDESYTCLFVFPRASTEYTVTWLNNETGRHLSEPLPDPGPRLNISDIARAEKGLTPPTI